MRLSETETHTILKRKIVRRRFFIILNLFGLNAQQICIIFPFAFFILFFMVNKRYVYVLCNTKINRCIKQQLKTEVFQLTFMQKTSERKRYLHQIQTGNIPVYYRKSIAHFLKIYTIFLSLIFRHFDFFFFFFFCMFSLYAFAMYRFSLSRYIHLRLIDSLLGFEGANVCLDNKIE